MAQYGFIPLQCGPYDATRTCNTEEYISYISIQAPHLTLQEPHEPKLYDGVRNAIARAGDQIILHDTIILK